MIQWLCNKIYWAGRNYDDRLDQDVIAISDDSDVDMERALKFAILPARGGCVFEIRHRDPKTHERETITHVIPDGTDIAKAVGDIVAMELLRR